MNQQEQIALLAAALQEVGKMPEEIQVGSDKIVRMFSWERLRCGGCRIESISSDIAPKIVLAALCGVAAEVCEDSHLVIVRCVTERMTTWEVWRFDHDGSEFISDHAHRIEALAAAVKIAGKGEKQ